MPMYNLIEYSNSYSKTSRSLWQYYKDESNDNLADSESFKSKEKVTENTRANINAKVVQIIVPLKYLRNFWRTPEMSLVNFEVNLILTWSSTYVITYSTGGARFLVTDTKLYLPFVTLATQDKIKLLQQLKSGFNRTINLNKKEQLIGTNISQTQKRRHKSDI